MLAVPPIPASAQAAPDAIDWQRCSQAPGEPAPTGKVECATIKVPLDWSDPGGRTIEIGLARRKATKPDARIGSILLDPGGPGGSGVAEVKRKQTPFTEAVSERFDVIGVDPRGVNTSTQIKCDGKLLEQASAAQAAATGSAAGFEALKQANAKLSQNCRELTGPLYDHVDSRQIARDIEAIRIALGESKITQVGYSYGTLAAQHYAEMFPKRVRATVTDGNMDHSIRSFWDFLDAQTAAIENNFVQWADWCDKTSDCALHHSDARKVYGELRERAKKGELTHPSTGDKVDFARLTGLAQRVNLPEYWKDLAVTLKHLHEGTKPDERPAPGPRPAPEVANYPRQATFCQDWDFRVSDYAELKRGIARLTNRYPNINWNPNATAAALDCVGYRGRTTNPQARLKVKGAAPLLMVGNINDYATAYTWTRNAARQSQARLLTYEGFGHTVFPSTIAFGPSACVNAAVDAYLIQLKVPAQGLSCPAIEVPGEGQKPTP
ncbi:alpha/beta hydrolase [Nonomuraea sp. GTA35]|uniref:alpha/beta hydrolase n=1 Tax=Nonomuraea sp. GTA35 TaxID=1676746 RepID=UPI0035BFA478